MPNAMLFLLYFECNLLDLLLISYHSMLNYLFTIDPHAVIDHEPF